MEDMQGFQLIMNFVIFPLFFSSGALFPLDGAPKFLEIVARLNPVTYAVEGVRYGLFGVSQISPLVCLAVIGGFSLLMILVGGALFRKIKYNH